MFDPIVFENLKVALENQLYDLDNLDGRISIIDRKDILDMAVMSRQWSLRFMLTGGHKLENSNLQHSFINAEVVLHSSISDISDEILEREIKRPACALTVRFHCIVEDPVVDCPKVESILEEIWKRGIIPNQKLSQMFGQATRPIAGEQIWLPFFYYNTIELTFDRRIGEEQMEDLEEFIECVLASLEALEDALL